MEIKPDYRQFVAEDRELLAMLAFLSGAVPVVYGRCEQLIAYTSLGLLVFVLLVCLTRYVMLVSHQWIIGDETLCTVKGVLARHTDYIELYRIVDYKESQTLLQRLMGIKTVTVFSTLRNVKQIREFMRLRTISIAMLLAVTGRVCAQQVDPALTAAVVAQTAVLNDIYNTRDNTQKKIIAAEAAVTVAMERMHQVENKILDYLSNAQGAMQNIYQIKRAAELVTVEIPQNMTMASLYPFMQQLVTSGSYNVTGSNGEPEKHKVNLLDSAERYYVANEVVTKLENINTDLWLLAWQIRTMSWHDLWFGLDPEGWATVMSGKAVAESLIYQWENL